MNVVKATWHWVLSHVRKMRELVSGDDLQDAQDHRGDYRERKANPGAGAGIIGGGGG
jgi:hypothetical protein